MTKPAAINQHSSFGSSSWTMIGFADRAEAEVWQTLHEKESWGYGPTYQFVEDPEHGWTIRCHMYNSCD